MVNVIVEFKTENRDVNTHVDTAKFFPRSRKKCLGHRKKKCDPRSSTNDEIDVRSECLIDMQKLGQSRTLG